VFAQAQTESLSRRRFHFASYTRSYAWNAGRRRDRCSVIARLKFLAVCLRRDCSASREFMEGQPARARTAVYNYICPEPGAGTSPLQEDCSFAMRWKGGNGTEECRGVTHSSCFTRENGGKQLCSGHIQTIRIKRSGLLSAEYTGNRVKKIYCLHPEVKDLILTILITLFFFKKKIDKNNETAKHVQFKRVNFMSILCQLQLESVFQVRVRNWAFFEHIHRWTRVVREANREAIQQ